MVVVNNWVRKLYFSKASIKNKNLERANNIVAICKLYTATVSEVMNFVVFPGVG